MLELAFARGDSARRTYTYKKEQLMKRVLTNLVAFAALGIFALSAAAQQGRWRLVQAEYGAGNSWSDVTPTVRSLIQNHQLDIRVDNATLGGDPAPHMTKTLRLRMENERGETKTLTFSEKAVVQLSIYTRDDDARGREQFGHDSDHDRDRRDFDHDGDRGPRLHVTRAMYGAEGHFADVTALLNSNIQNGELSLPVNNATMGGDPAYDRPKTLRVWYRFDGRDFQATVNEKGVLNLPGPGIDADWHDAGHRDHDRDGDRNGALGRGYGLRILRADYGVEGRFADVTQRLASQIQGDQLELEVNNYTMGGDPADHQRKSLTIWYSFNGRAAVENVPEGGSISLPAEADFFQGRLRVMRAQYGADFRYFDVTDRLNSLIQNDQLEMRIDNASMGGDPAPDRPKRLSVVYLFDGAPYRTIVNEHSALELPNGGTPIAQNDSATLEILHATYGAEGRRADVTNIVRSAANGNQLQFAVSNGALGGDPAPGLHKNLRVIYRWNGMRYEAVAAEGTTLALP